MARSVKIIQGIEGESITRRCYQENFTISKVFNNKRRDVTETSSKEKCFANIYLANVSGSCVLANVLKEIDRGLLTHHYLYYVLFSFFRNLVSQNVNF